MERNESTRTTYEVHALSDVPVIFHHNRVCTRSRYANWHENVEILYFTGGTGTVICEDKRVPVCAGDITVIDSGLLHRIESDNEVLYDCLIVDEAFCRSNGLNPGRMTFPRVIRNVELERLYNNVADTFGATDGYRLPALRAATLAFMVALMRDHGEPVKAPPQDASAAVRTAIGYIRSHYSEPLDLDLLSTEVGLSKYHFIRKFKEATGQTVVSYINAIRIERAERLLREGQLSVAAVAEACGFPNHSYFSKVFCRLRGMLPSEVGTKP